MYNTRSETFHALSSLRICDFTGQLAGAGATRILSIFGAQVVRIEDILTQGGWDIFRGTGPWPDERRGINLGGAFNNHNVEKMGITLNIREQEAKKILSEIISVSDVVTENFSKGVLSRWGFSYEEMKKVKPDVIYISNSGFGHNGPYSKFKTWGPIVQAVSGLTFQSGLPDRPPAGWGYSFMDHTGAYFMAIAILMAVFHRNKTGVGQWLDMSCTDGAATLNGPAILDFTVNGVKGRRSGMPNSNRSTYPLMAPHGIYRCSGEDNWVAISIRDDEEWRRFVQIIGPPYISENIDLEKVRNRESYHDVIDSHIETWTINRTPDNAAKECQSAGIPAAPVQKPESRIEHDKNTEDWELFPTVDHGEIGKIRVDGMPIKLSQTPAKIMKGAPLLGQDNSYVYGDLLGMASEQLELLTEIGVI